MGLVNTWIGYLDRTYAQAKEAILQKIGQRIPTMTDHTESNPFIVILNVFLGIAELLHYYLDNIVRELYLHSARQYGSAQKIAKLFSYRLKGYGSASVLVTFSIPDPIATPTNIPLGTKVSGGSIVFETAASATIPAGSTEVSVLVVQRVSKQEIFTADGTDSAVYLLEPNTVDKSMSVTVGGVQYTFVGDFLLSVPTDQVYTTEITENKEFRVVFPASNAGAVPNTDQVIQIDYDVSEGLSGNVPPYFIDTVVTDLGFTVEVRNEDYGSGGTGIEDLETLKKSIPASLRTLNRAVTPLDYKDIAEGDPGVAKAFVSFECGLNVSVYVVPTGLGSASQNLLDSVKDRFYDETKLILLGVDVLPAGRINAIIKAKVTVADVYNKTKTVLAIKDNLSAFLSSSKQEISGSVYVGDIYQVIENTVGVDHSEILLLSTVPEATITSGTSTLLWDRELLEGSSNAANWRLVYLGASVYDLYKDSVFMGKIQDGQNIAFPELRLSINANNYTIGDQWEFHTYPYNGTIHLDEPSIITLIEENIEIIADGGI